MEKLDFKKLALLGIASGALIASQATASEPNEQTNENSEEAGVLLAHAGCGGHGGGSSYCNGVQGGQRHGCNNQGGGYHSCNNQGGQRHGCQNQGSNQGGQRHGCQNQGNTQGGGHHGCGGNSQVQPNTNQAPATPVAPVAPNKQASKNVPASPSNGGGTITLSANGCAAHGCGGNGGGSSGGNSQPNGQGTPVPQTDNVKKRANLQNGGNTNQAPIQGTPAK